MIRFSKPTNLLSFKHYTALCETLGQRLSAEDVALVMKAIDQHLNQKVKEAAQ